MGLKINTPSGTFTPKNSPPYPPAPKAKVPGMEQIKTPTNSKGSSGPK
jgi:hypothetical protein